MEIEKDIHENKFKMFLFFILFFIFGWASWIYVDQQSKHQREISSVTLPPDQTVDHRPYKED